MEGLTAVQGRIAEIQQRMATFAGATSVSGSAWLSAAAAAGLTSPASSATGSGTTAASVSGETAVVDAAKNYLGVPYLWGGTDPTKGLDCSGFTQRVFGDLGISLPGPPASRPRPAPPSPASPMPAPGTWSSSTTAPPAPGSTTSASTWAGAR